MTNDEAVSYLSAALSNLQTRGTSFSPDERRQVALTLSQTLAKGVHNFNLLALASLLSQDSRPEVRKEIAEALIHLPQNEFIRLGTLLTQDSNSLVAKAAQRSMARRQKTVEQTQRVSRKLSRVQSHYAAMEQKYGHAIMTDARRLAAEQYDTLVGDTIHNLNNIVTPVRIAISTLKRQGQEGRYDHALIQRNLTEMDRQMEYLSHFMAEMKEFAKAAPVERRPERIADILAESTRLARETCKTEGVKIDRIEVVSCASETLTFPLARCQMVAALIHILRNAYESFTDSVKKPRIEIAANIVDGGNLVVTVKDNGPGIDADNLVVLREFAPRKITTKPTGTGFGLPTANRYIVDGHDGTLSIESTPRKGTCVSIFIPDPRNEEKFE